MRRYLMLRAVAKFIGTLVLLVTVSGCKDIASFVFSPYPDVDLTATVSKVSFHEFEIPGKTTFVHFRYVVTVRSEVPVYFKIGEMTFSINGTRNTGAYYDSVASIAPHWQLMKQGENVIEAYAVFPGMIEASTVANVKFIGFGLSRAPESKG